MSDEVPAFFSGLLVGAIVTCLIMVYVIDNSWRNELVKKDLAAYTVDDTGAVSWKYKE